MKDSIIPFEEHNVRRIYDEKTETWYFSVVDILAVLTDSENPQVYWRVLKKRLLAEGANETVTNCNGLKMRSPDGKMRITDVADPQTLLRLIQSVPSPKAEPFKQWLAKVGYERMQEILDPEKSVDRARENWQRQGRSEKWIQQRMMGQETRSKLTDYWAGHEVKPGEEFAILTNIIHEEWSGVSIKDHKSLKQIGKQNLRDHMTEAELIFTALAEMSTRQIAETMEARGLEQNKEASKKGGGIAKKARQELEGRTGNKVITGKNYLPPKK